MLATGTLVCLVTGATQCCSALVTKLYFPVCVYTSYKFSQLRKPFLLLQLKKHNEASFCAYFAYRDAQLIILLHSLTSYAVLGTLKYITHAFNNL